MFWQWVFWQWQDCWVRLVAVTRTVTCNAHPNTCARPLPLPPHRPQVAHTERRARLLWSKEGWTDGRCVVFLAIGGR